MPSSARTRAQVGPTAATITPKRKASRSSLRRPALSATRSRLRAWIWEVNAAAANLPATTPRRCGGGAPCPPELPLVDELVQRRAAGQERLDERFVPLAIVDEDRHAEAEVDLEEHLGELRCRRTVLALSRRCDAFLGRRARPELFEQLRPPARDAVPERVDHGERPVAADRPPVVDGVGEGDLPADRPGGGDQIDAAVLGVGDGQRAPAADGEVRAEAVVAGLHPRRRRQRRAPQVGEYLM